MPAVAERVVHIPYTPRPFQREIGKLCRAKRFGVLVCHRRFGKTVLGVNINQQTAMMCEQERPRVAYIGPTYTQGKATSWDYMQFYARPIPGTTFNQSELRIDYPNQGQARIFGADNPDALRGIYLDRAVLDEFGLHPAKTFSEVIGPTLVDRGGSALFLGTPNGKNQFYDIAQHAKAAEAAGDPEWFYREYKASQTGLLDAAYLAQARSLMTSDEYAQEFECSFEAAVKGAIYSKEIEAARISGRVCGVPVDSVLPVQTFWDLGIGDYTGIWFVQAMRGGDVRVVDYYEANGEGLPHYAHVLRQKGYLYGPHWAPHDILVREFSSGRSRLETAASLGIQFQIVPNVPVEDGIHAVRMILPRCYFDAVRTQSGVEALQHYRRDYNQRLNEFKATPVHDWACVTGDTEVLTRSGTYQIQYLPETGEVLTPCGWKTYERPRVTRRAAPLVAVTFDDGLTVKCTPEHRFLTASGWTFASDLRTGSPIQSSLTRSRSILMALCTAFGRRNGTTLAEVVGSIVTCGEALLAPFLTAATSITATATRHTTLWLTSNACQHSSIWPTQGSNMARFAPFISARQQGPVRLLGMHRKQDDSGTADRRSGQRVGRSGSESRNRVSAAARRWMRSFVSPVTRRNTARRLAKPLRIAHVTPLDERADVWCLTVPDGHEFSLLNGAITHNSHGADAFRYLAVALQPVKDKSADKDLITGRYTAPSTMGGVGWMA